MPYFTTNDNVNLYYEDKGSGEIFVLINTYSCRRHDFKRQTPGFLKKKNYIFLFKRSWRFRKSRIWFE